MFTNLLKKTSISGMKKYGNGNDLWRSMGMGIPSRGYDDHTGKATPNKMPDCWQFHCCSSICKAFVKERSLKRLRHTIVNTKYHTDNKIKLALQKSKFLKLATQNKTNFNKVKVWWCKDSMQFLFSWFDYYYYYYYATVKVTHHQRPSQAQAKM